MKRFEFNINLIVTPPSSVLKQLDRIEKNQEKIMAAIDDLKATLNSIVASVTEIEGDIQTLITALPSEGGLSAEETAEIKAQLTALDDKLKGVAGIFTPPTP